MKLLIGLLTLFLCLFLTPVVSAHSQTQIIKMTPDGFEPQEITVDTNSTVIFLNQDSDLHWPASNNHPTHELYPLFDPKRPIESGKSWVFKPTVVGVHKYHDSEVTVSSTTLQICF